MRKSRPDNSNFFGEEKAIEAPPSRTRLKKEDRARQKTGERLTRLSDRELEQIELPEEIREALLFARRITSHGAKKREIKHIGSLLRHIDIAPIQKAIDHISQHPDKKPVEKSWNRLKSQEE
ncbi:MAG: DUF615 domain-containing protein [Deltaproteobacteria bacterium]|nr:DUF615 domain-containing protein [Deltaproteobacteria bacterium]